jgi:hypothetical protein
MQPKLAVWYAGTQKSHPKKLEATIWYALPTHLLNLLTSTWTTPLIDYAPF